jgi:hypothetical protein
MGDGTKYLVGIDNQGGSRSRYNATRGLDRCKRQEQDTCRDKKEEQSYPCSQSAKELFHCISYFLQSLRGRAFAFMHFMKK